MATRRRANSSKPLVRLAMFKARPVNKDTRRAMGYKPSSGKAAAKRSRKTTGQAVLTSKPTITKPKVRLVTAAEEAERKAKLHRMFGLRNVHVVAPNSSSKRTR